MYGSSFMCVTAKPRASINAPIDAEVRPFPIEETTPPVTRTNLVRRFTGGISEKFGTTPSRFVHSKVRASCDARENSDTYACMSYARRARGAQRHVASRYVSKRADHAEPNRIAAQDGHWPHPRVLRGDAPRLIRLPHG